MNNKGFIFDLDGVIVDTAHFHYKAWKKTAKELCNDFIQNHLFALLVLVKGMLFRH